MTIVWNAWLIFGYFVNFMFLGNYSQLSKYSFYFCGESKKGVFFIIKKEKMTRKEREQLLNEYSESGVEAILNQGATWFFKTFLPNLNIATETNSVDEGILADCWFIVGDLFDLVFAPLQAQAAYEKAIEIDPDFTEAYAELASIHRDLGNYDLALENIQIALELDPLEADYQIQLDCIFEDINQKTPAFFSESNEKWPYYETLAAQKFEKLLEISNIEDDAFHNKMKAFAFKLLENEAESNKNWTSFVEKTPNREFNLIENFYLNKK
jgi:tetratricopeptide (TPR) repeat protein